MEVHVLTAQARAYYKLESSYERQEESDAFNSQWEQRQAGKGAGNSGPEWPGLLLDASRGRTPDLTAAPVSPQPQPQGSGDQPRMQRYRCGFDLGAIFKLRIPHHKVACLQSFGFGLTNDV